MTITYTWSIQQMSAYPDVDGEQDVVFNVAWLLNGTDGTYSSSAYGAIGIPLVSKGAFTPYPQLTQDQVIGWVEAAMGSEEVDSYKANIAQQIANQVNPPVVTPPLPWAPTEPPAPPVPTPGE